MKKLVCLLLACLLLLGSTALAEYNTLQWPLVKEGEKASISVVVLRNDANQTIDVNEKWFWKYLEKYSGIDFEITEILQSAKDEKMNLMFAMAELPDILMGLNLTTEQLVTYGVVDKMLLDMSPYITEDIMPNLSAWMEAYPISRSYVTTPDGAIYSLPCYSVVEYTVGNGSAVAVNKEAVEAIGKQLPRTLDELNDVLYALKAAYPDSTPLAGGKAASDPRGYILNAMGYLLKGGDGSGDGWGIAIKNGEPVIPAYTPDFKEFLKQLNQYYNDGIIREDFFTADNTSVNAQMQEHKNFVFTGYPYTALPEYADFSQWCAAYPLTSALNETAQWQAPNPFLVGGVAVSAKAKSPELICRFLDFFYSDMGMMSLWEGPMNGSEEAMGLTGGWHFKEGAVNRSFVDVENGLYATGTAYVYNVSGGMPLSFGNRSHSLGREKEGLYVVGNVLASLWGLKVDNEIVWDMNSGDANYRSTYQTNLEPYETAGFPAITYFTEEETLAMNDLAVILQPYIETEVAKFIAGKRSLDEFDAFQNELKGMGAGDYLAYYQKAYENYLATK